MITYEVILKGFIFRIMLKYTLPEFEEFNKEDYDFSRCIYDAEEILKLKNDNLDYSLLNGKTLKEANPNLCNVNKFYNLANTGFGNNTIISVLDIDFNDFPIDEMLNITTENLQQNT